MSRHEDLARVLKSGIVAVIRSPSSEQLVSVARALSFNGLGNVLHVVTINGGTHANPVFAGDTVYAWSEVLEKADLPRHPDLGALRLRLVATKDRPCHDFPCRDADGRHVAVEIKRRGEIDGVEQLTR